MVTAAAISTPRAAGGIAVIRISGDGTIKCAEKVFKPYGKSVSEMEGYTCAYGVISDGCGGKLDDGILTVFRAPHSYTGEDVCEISCHGGIFVADSVLQAVLRSGAVPAQAGEFTKRAFLNGKLSLTQAEGVMDIISAEGKAAHKCAVSLRDGKLFKSIKAVSDRLQTLLGSCAAWVDYPEEDIAEVSEDAMAAELSELSGVLSDILKTYDSGIILKNGIDTCIVGKPNVGKSTLMNLLSGCERSIVTDIAGTTRDIVEESVRLGDITLRLADTAGIHSTDDIVENFGVQKAVERLGGASLIIAVFDGSCPPDTDDLKLIELLSQADVSEKILAVINKSDKGTTEDWQFVEEKFLKTVTISANDSNSAAVVEAAVREIFLLDKVDLNGAVISNERQRSACFNALSEINAALETLNCGYTLDAVNVVLDNAFNYLLELTGERATENVVNEVFSHFCVGK